MLTASLLIELHTEELPPKALAALAQSFAAQLEAGLRARHLLADDSHTTTFATPRRLAVHISKVKSRAADRPFKQKLMPLAVAQDKAKNWTAAFLKKLEALGRGHLAGLPIGKQDGPDALVVENDGKADAVFLTSVAAGQPLIAAAQAALEEAIDRLPIPKLMSYQLADGVTTVQFVRPAHRLVALHGHEPLPLQALGLIGGTKTFGHRFHSQGEIAVHSADTYEQQLEREGRVIASFARRRARIVELLTAAANRLHAVPLTPDALLDEVTALVEWPVVYDSEFEAEFLAVPPECLILTMQQHQRYFALQDAAGRLLNRFLLVSNLDAADGGAAIRAGNARVVRARLADAKFFYDQDRKHTLESRVPGLANVVYHNKLGSQLERVERITGIAVEVARALGADVTHVERAARLAKADLRTEMVGEFPELQGVMGRYYARHDGEAPDVADAIEEHYRPRFADDALPRTVIGTCVALADKLEALVGLFGVGERPTGDKDPFALRRHAIGVLRLLMEKSLALPLQRLLALAQQAFEGVRAFKPVAGDVASFLYDRLRGLLREQGYSANEVEAVVALAPQRIDQVPAQLAAVRAFMQLPESGSLAAANKRIGNILKKSAAGSREPAAEFDPRLLFEPAEKELAEAFAQTARVADAHFAAGDYTAALAALAPLKVPVDRFFDEVLVNVDDERLRANRLALLARLHAAMNRVADLSLLAAS
ncbi:MAG TPA: glycine--tRNA ligase subunit beta [Burkholderiaceae bacterium]|nr:glycine--tRNA ligase subunit beta [Burkholderiaceae bacterium]